MSDSYAAMAQSPAVIESASNWVWLARLESPVRADLLFDHDGRMAKALAPHFPDVRALEAEAGDESDRTDCIVVRGLAGLGAGRAAGAEFERQLAVALADWARRLRPGGCLWLGFDNAAWVRRGDRRGRTGAARARVVRRVVENAGYREVRLYYAEPAHDAPLSLVPVTAAATFAHERMQHTRPGAAALRPLVARLGLHELLYPAVICLGYR